MLKSLIFIAYFVLMVVLFSINLASGSILLFIHFVILCGVALIWALLKWFDLD